MAVFVLDKRKKPFMPCSEKRRLWLLSYGRYEQQRGIMEAAFPAEF